MAKQNMIQRELKRIKLVKKYAKKRHTILENLKTAKKLISNIFISKKFTTFTWK